MGMATYNRQITDVTEFAMRVENYTQIHNFINEHNASGANWVAGHNQFSDWSFAEYKAMLGYTGTRDAVKEATIFEESNATEVNWITGGAVTPVKDQGQCGSCWAFSNPSTPTSPAPPARRASACTTLPPPPPSPSPTSSVSPLTTRPR